MWVPTYHRIMYRINNKICGSLHHRDDSPGFTGMIHVESTAKIGLNMAHSTAIGRVLASFRGIMIYMYPYRAIIRI